ncbi:MAG: M14 family metallocarboxypeptidase [Verrucomicrobia bacterium]|nr:M14 family metallocarboxypeptidase [Verrucomicrobiota bacterium]
MIAAMQRPGKNNGGYHGETIDIRSVLRDVEAAAQQHGWISAPFHADREFKWLALHRHTSLPGSSHPAPRTYISTGIHGDEPAGPRAVLRLLQENRWPENLDICLCPCLNPTGFALSRRENNKGLDLNRDYRHFKSDEIRAHVKWLERQPAFALTLCLHEDWEARGFYVYELNPDQRPSLAQAIVEAVACVCPIDFSPLIEGRKAKDGIISPNLDPNSRPEWPEACWLLQNRTRQSYTLEAPSDFPLATRVTALVTGVNAALARLDSLSRLSQS